MYGALEDRALFALFERISLTVIVRVYLALNLFARPTKHGSDPAIQARVAQVTLARYALGKDDESAQRQVQRALRELADKDLVRVVKHGVRGSPAVYELAPNGAAPCLSARRHADEATENTGEAVCESPDCLRRRIEETCTNPPASEGHEENGVDHGQAYDPYQQQNRAHAGHDLLRAHPSWAHPWRAD